MNYTGSLLSKSEQKAASPCWTKATSLWCRRHYMKLRGEVPSYPSETSTCPYRS